MNFKRGDYILRVEDVPQWLTNVTKGKTYMAIGDTNDVGGIPIIGDDGKLVKPDSNRFVLDKNYIVTQILNDL